jgi:hypothetical protein
LFEYEASSSVLCAAMHLEHSKLRVAWSRKLPVFLQSSIFCGECDIPDHTRKSVVKLVVISNASQNLVMKQSLDILTSLLISLHVVKT